MKAIVRALWGVLGAVCVSVLAADAPTDARIDAMAAATAHAAGGGPVITARFFGQHLHRLVLREGEQAVRTAWPAVAVGRLRLWDSSTRWGDVAPAPGRWNFDRLDAYVQAAHDHGAEVLYTLGSTPRWASSRPDEPCSYGFGCSAEPARMSDWADYVRMVARRYRGRIHAYELWNEPHFSDIERDRHAPANHSGFYTGNIATMVQMARIAREVLDAEDPQAVLATPGFVNGPDRLEMFLAAGGSRYVQAVAYHLYASSDAQFARQLVELRALMRRQGVAHLPLWSTEAGVEVYAEHEALPQGMRRIDPAQASALRAQVLLLAAAGGVQRYDYYAWDNDRSGLVDRRGVARSGAAAFRRVQGWLIGTRMSGCRSMPNRGVRCEGQRDGQHLVFVWSEQPATLQTLQWERPAGWALAAVETLDGAEDVVVSQTPTSLVVSRLSSAPVMLRLTP